MADCDAGAVTVTDRTWKFCPFGIAPDSVSNILVSDTFMIHIIDVDGIEVHPFLEYRVLISDAVGLG